MPLRILFNHAQKGTGQKENGFKLGWVATET